MLPLSARQTPTAAQAAYAPQSSDTDFYHMYKGGNNGFVKQIDTYARYGGIEVIALELLYGDGTKSGILGDKTLPADIKPDSWIRKPGEKIIEISVAVITKEYIHHIADETYALTLKTTEGLYSAGVPQPGWSAPIHVVWKASDAEPDVLDFDVKYYVNDPSTSWVVDISVIPYKPPTPGPKIVKGIVISEPVDEPGNNFKISFVIDGMQYIYNASHGGDLTEPFSGDVEITYMSTSDFTQSRSFFGYVGFQEFSISIETDEFKFKVSVDGGIAGGPKHKIAINGAGEWSNNVYKRA